MKNLSLSILCLALLNLGPSASALAHATNAVGQDYLQHLLAAREQLQSLQAQPDLDQLQKLIGYFKLSDDDRRAYEQVLQLAQNMTPFDWAAVQQGAASDGFSMAANALDPSLEERQAPPSTPMDNYDLAKLPEGLSENLSGFVKSGPHVIFSRHVDATPGIQAHPLLIGGGFPFNQTQFQSFNDQLKGVAETNLYDPICTGLSVLYDTAINHGNDCRPYKATTPLQLLHDELAIRYAFSDLAYAVPWTGASLSQIEQAIFRITRFSFHGITLVDQARALVRVAEQRGYARGQAILTGLSYGGLAAAKTAAMNPGLFRSVVLFSPGVDNPAHELKSEDASALLEQNSTYRLGLQNLVKAIAYSPRYDAYLPNVLRDDNQGFRDSLVKKMLGEMDADIRQDLVRIQDRLYVVTGAKDASIPPASQADAVKYAMRTHPDRVTYIVVPSGGHALWGNPQQANEKAVLRILREVEKDANEEGQGALRAGNVYKWRDDKGDFDLVGAGESAIDQTLTQP